VVVRGDRARTQVGLRTHFGITDVGEVRHLRTFADFGVLHLDERADLGSVGDVRPWANVRVRTDGTVVGDLGVDHGGVRDRGAFADDRVDEPAVGTDRRTG